MRRLRFVLVLVLLLAPARAASASYPWPFKPFDKQHPIRGGFGDPRTVYMDGILSGAFEGPGFFSFHQGVDIAAPNGTPIYAVANGTAHYLGAATLNLVTPGKVIFQYFHIVTVVGEGQKVYARKTVLGYVQPPYAHVHLTEIDRAHVVNPLQGGHLTPYSDTTRPTIREIEIRNQTGTLQTPLGLCGRIELDVDAFDTTPMRVPGTFKGLPIAPAVVKWTLRHLSGRVAVPWRLVADFRHTLPTNGQFWSTYAKGTYENAPRFGNQQYRSMPGRYLFLLSPNFDTTLVPNGIYVITVRVADIRGNTAALSERLSVLNAHDGVCPGSLPASAGGGTPPEPPGASNP
jgi:hypothetical protein